MLVIHTLVTSVSISQIERIKKDLQLKVEAVYMLQYQHGHVVNYRTSGVSLNL